MKLTNAKISRNIDIFRRAMIDGETDVLQAKRLGISTPRVYQIRHQVTRRAKRLLSNPEEECSTPQSMWLEIEILRNFEIDNLEIPYPNAS